MTQKTRTKSFSKEGTDSLEFDDFELHSTMQNFLQEEEQKKDTGKGIWNLATISGLSMLTIGSMFMLSWAGLPMGDLSEFALRSIHLLPFIGGVLVSLIGFGYLIGDRKRVNRYNRKIRREQKLKQKAAGISNTKSTSAKNSYKNMNDIHGADDTFGSTFNTLRNDLESDFNSSTSTYSNSNFESFASTEYGYKQSKKLMKSRIDKKFTGVCGGIAKYFGISSTIARLLFVILFFMSGGTSLLIYIGLSLVIPKEPLEPGEDFYF